MRQLNQKALALIVLGAIGLGILGFGVHEFQMRRNATSFLREAKRAQDEGRFEDAASHFRRYVRLAPTDTEGLILYGFLLDDLSFPPDADRTAAKISRLPRNPNKASGAYFTLDRALQRQPDRNDVRKRVVALALAVGRFVEAKDHLENHLLKEFPNDPDLLEQLAICQIGLGEFNAAETSLVAAIEKSPEHLEAYVSLAALRSERLQRADTSVQALDLMVSHNPKNFRAYRLRSEWHLRNLQQLKAGGLSGTDNAEKIREIGKFIENDLKEALKLEPNDLDVHIIAATTAHAMGRFEDARDLAEKGLAIAPDDARFLTLLSESESALGHADAAIESLRKGIKVASDSVFLRWNLANLLINQEDVLGNQEKLQEVLELISELKKSTPDDPQVRFLESRIMIRRRQWHDAISELELIRPRLLDSPALQKQAEYMLGLAYGELNLPEEQVKCLRRAIDVDPDFWLARMALAVMLATTNHLDDALVEYKRLESSPEFAKTARLGVARTLLLINRREKAGNRQWREFDEKLNEIKSKDAGEPQVALLEMEKSLAQSNVQDAVKPLDAFLEAHPDQMSVWTAKIALAQSAKDWQSVEDLLQTIESKFGDVPQVRLTKARYLLQRYSAEAVDKLKELLTPAPSWSVSQNIQFATDFAPLMFGVGAFDNAKQLASLVAQEEPTNLRMRLLLLDIGLRTSQTALVTDSLAEIERIAPEGADWLYGKATSLRLNMKEVKNAMDFAENAKPAAEALDYLKKARTKRPTWSRVPLLMAEIQEQRGAYDQATESYLEAIRLGERAPSVTTRALALLNAKRRFDDVDRLLSELQESKCIFSDAMVRLQIERLLKLGKKEEANKAVEVLVRDASQTQDPIWLGDVYTDLRRLDDAETQFRAAIQVRPEDFRAWVKLVQTFALMKQSATTEESAQAAIAKVEEMAQKEKSALPPNEAELVNGRCHEILGNRELAKKSYSAAIENAPGDVVTSQVWTDYLLRTGATSEAELVLRKTISSSTQNDEAVAENRRWARRKLATILLSQGRYEKLGEAMDVIKLNLLEKKQSNSTEDQRIKAQILSRQGQRQEAISVLEKLVVQDSAAPQQLDDRFLLQKLYAEDKNISKSRNELRKLIAARKGEPLFLSTYAQRCLEAKEISEAQLYCELLKEAAPEQAMTVDVETKILFAKAQYGEVAKELKEFGSKGLRDQEDPQSIPMRKAWVAKRFEEFAKILGDKEQTAEQAEFNAEAEAFYTQFVQDRPQDMMILAEFLAGTAQVDRALDLLKEYGAKAPVGQLGNLCLSIRRNANASTSQLLRLQNLLREFFQSHDNSTSLLLLVADLMSWRGDYKGAETLYREVLQREENNVAALNNLAALLAMTQSEVEDAMKMIIHAIEVAGNLDALIDTRGLVHLSMNHPESAVLDFKFALAQGGNNRERRFHLALAFAKIKEFGEARKALNLTQKLEDHDEEPSLKEQDLHPIERQALINLREELNAVERKR